VRGIHAAQCRLFICTLLATAPCYSQARNSRAPPEESSSPWLVVPTLSVDPKLGTSLGALAAYLHYFDDASPVSIFGLTGQYTTTGSVLFAAFGKASFGEDHHRLLVLIGGGEIKNDYSDYLGTGVPLKSNGDMGAYLVRYLYRVSGDWFIGGQAINTNYLISGEEAFDQQVLDILGIKGFNAGGLGVVGYHDSRDDENMPTRGWLLNANNVAYRDWLGGSQDFDVYRMDFRSFWSHGHGNVFAIRQNNQWTSSAPAAANATVVLRGYKLGQYLGKYMSSLEAEERFRLAERWTSTLFAGVACLYGDKQNCSDSKNLYPNWGAGVQYILRPKERMVVNLEYAGGKDGNYGVYVKLGYSF
jgi:hypothetical protein